MDKQIRRYIKNKGRSNVRFVALPHNMLDSAAWKHLRPGAGFVFIEIKKRYNGGNNGNIPLSHREAAAVAHCGKGTAHRLLAELIAHGFIKQANKGHYGNRHATTWILTCEVYQGRCPSNEWKDWKPENKKPSTCNETA